MIKRMLAFRGYLRQEIFTAKRLEDEINKSYCNHSANDLLDLVRLRERQRSLEGAEHYLNTILSEYAPHDENKEV